MTYNPGDVVAVRTRVSRIRGYNEYVAPWTPPEELEALQECAELMKEIVALEAAVEADDIPLSRSGDMLDEDYADKLGQRCRDVVARLVAAKEAQNG